MPARRTTVRRRPGIEQEGSTGETAIAPRTEAAPSIDDLRAMSAFRELDDDTLTAVRAAIAARPVSPGQLVFMEGEPAPGVWFVRGGRVRIYKNAPDGREQVLCVAEARTCTGCPLFFGGSNPASVEAVDHGTLYFLPEEATEPLLDRFPKLGLALLRALLHRERTLLRVASTLALPCVASRLARVLVHEGGTTAGARIRLTHAQLAERAGVAREVVSRTLAQWARRGLTANGRGEIVVLNSEALRRHLRDHSEGGDFRH